MFWASNILARLALPLLFAGAIAGCSKAPAELFTGQTEAEANDMVMVLRSHGIAATKIQTKAGVNVMAPDGDFTESVKVLEAEGLPRQKRPSVVDLFPSGKMFTTPAEEGIRSRFALEQQIAANLQMIQGVRNAQVVLAMPEQAFRGPQLPASASVMLIYDDLLELEGLVPRVKLFVQNSVPQLQADRIGVAMFHSKGGDPAQAATSPPAAAAASSMPATVSGIAPVAAAAAASDHKVARR